MNWDRLLCRIKNTERSFNFSACNLVLWNTPEEQLGETIENTISF